MLRQSRPADEIVINDNGSSDATVAIVERYI
ncbi:MAG: glycosyltransferase family 2 protein, partial [Chloroflexota bacterium]|nr:glycosyltransferase family 2 protein [Chloroflexota bacterium]